MQLTDKQEEGLKLAVEKYKAGKRYVVISGYAGSGKSTLVQHIIAALQVNERDVVYCAYTGKATLVLSRKGCKNVSTLHKFLYRARLNRLTGKYSFFPRECLEYPYKVAVIDELSMVPKDMWELILKHKIFVIALGDPGQLGPIKESNDTGMLKKPHVFLDEIMRQAEGNEIIKLSMDIRTGHPLLPFDGQHVRVIESNEFSAGMLEWADQILCAKNDTRFNLNNEMRKYACRSEEPEVGDKIICLTNYWEDLSDKEQDPLVNGTLGWITECYKYYNHGLGIDVLNISMETELGDTYSGLTIDYKLLTQNESGLSKQDFIRLSKNPSTKALIPKEFAYGYAITTWKAQGSEWDNILLFEESFPWKTEDHRRYLYTGITRASEKIVVVKK